MHTFLNLPLLDINRNYEMFAHHSFVLPYTLITMCSYSEQDEDTTQVLEINLMLKLTNSNISNGFHEISLH